jgi:hypothetical protein
VCVIAAPTGSGKTTYIAGQVAEVKSTVWLAARHEDVAATVQAIERAGGRAASVVPLDGYTHGPTGLVKNCKYPDTIRKWQAKGYSYKTGFCSQRQCCSRRGDPEQCPYLKSMKDLEAASIAVLTKALARGPDFWCAYGNAHRLNVVIDEDPIGLLRPLVTITRDELIAFFQMLEGITADMQGRNDRAGLTELQYWWEVAAWAFSQINGQPASGDPVAVDVPISLRRPEPADEDEQQSRKAGRKTLDGDIRKRMRDDPDGMVRNLRRDLLALAWRAVDKTAYATSKELFFHARVSIPWTRTVTVLDATANANLLRPVFAPRPVEVLFNERVTQAGRVVQVMDANRPRSSLNNLPKKVIRLLDAIGDRHPEGKIVLIAPKSCVEELAAASRHAGRFITAHFGALRGRNDLETRPDCPIACHIVVGSPKTNEKDRQQLALAVYGRRALPFPKLVDVCRGVIGRVPLELSDEEREQIWEVRYKGYTDPQMQAVYEHTVTAELTQAADRARVLIHQEAMVYLLTNEPCPALWFAEMALAEELFDLTARRGDYAANYAAYETKARELLYAGQTIGNTDVCRAMGLSPRTGERYWQDFRAANASWLTGKRKVRKKAEQE